MDRTTRNRMVNEFSIKGDLGGVDLGIAGRLEATIERLLKPLVEGGNILKQSLTNTSTGQYGTSYRFSGSKNVQDMVMAAVREELRGLKDKFANSTLDIGGSSRKLYTETTERILDPRTQAAIRAQALRAGGTSDFDRATGMTTTFLPRGEARRYHTAVQESDARYLAGGSRGAPGYSSSANIDELATAAIARKNATMEASEKAHKAFVKANPDSAIGKEDKARQKEQAGNFVKGGTLAVLSIIAGLITTSLSFLSKILGATMEVAKNTLASLNAGNRTNMSGVDVDVFSNRSRALGYGQGQNPFVDSMSMLVQRFSNPENLGDLKDVATLLKGKTADALKMITTGNVDPEQMLYSIFGDVTTQLASGKGGVMNRNSIGAALAASLAKMNTALDPGTSDLFNTLITRMSKDSELIGGKTYDADYFRNYIGQLTSGPVVNDMDKAAAAKGADKFNALGSDVTGLWNTFFTKFLAQIGDIATSIRNLIRPLADWLDPMHAFERNKDAMNLNNQFTGEIGDSMRFQGKQFFKTMSAATGGKFTGKNWYDGSALDPAQYLAQMKGEAEAAKTPALATAFQSKYGIDAVKALDIASQYNSIPLYSGALEDLAANRTEFAKTGTYPFPVGKDAITLDQRAQQTRMDYILGISRMKTKAEENISQGVQLDSSRAILDMYKDFPDMRQFTAPDRSGTGKMDEAMYQGSLALARDAIMTEMRKSGKFAGVGVVPGESFNIGKGADGQIVVTLVNKDKKPLGSIIVKNDATGAIKTTVFDSSDILESMASTNTKQTAKVGN